MTPAVEVRERPILFSGPMVRALLDGRKTQTRRLVKPQPIDGDSIHWNRHSGTFKCGRLRDSENAWRDIVCPYGKPGDRLWVRENWAPRLKDGKPDPNARYVKYRADGDPKRFPSEEMDWHNWGAKWHPSIHMPRWASRITLEIAEVRVERLQAITEADAKAEGAEVWPFNSEQPMTSGELGSENPYRGGFACLWDDIHEEATWFSNPFVWVITFTRQRPPIADAREGE